MSRPDTLAHYMLRSINKAHRHFRLFADGDRVLVAVSGGKDSLSMLDLLYRRRITGPERLELVVGHVRTDYHCGRAVPEAWLQEWCDQRGLPLHVVDIPVAERVSRSKQSHCFWCSRLRRRALFELARETGCGKLAFGHHADDVAETVVMNLFYNGRIEPMQARSELFGGALVVVRPMVWVEERDIVTFARAVGYPIAGEPCPDGAGSRRALVKRLLREADGPGTDVKRSIHGALSRYRPG